MHGRARILRGGRFGPDREPRYRSAAVGADDLAPSGGQAHRDEALPRRGPRPTRTIRFRAAPILIVAQNDDQPSIETELCGAPVGTPCGEARANKPVEERASLPPAQWLGPPDAAWQQGFRDVLLGMITALAERVHRVEHGLEGSLALLVNGGLYTPHRGLTSARSRPRNPSRRQMRLIMSKRVRSAGQSHDPRTRALARACPRKMRARLPRESASAPLLVHDDQAPDGRQEYGRGAPLGISLPDAPCSPPARAPSRRGAGRTVSSARRSAPRVSVLARVSVVVQGPRAPRITGVVW